VETEQVPQVIEPIRGHHANHSEDKNYPPTHVPPESTNQSDVRVNEFESGW